MVNVYSNDWDSELLVIREEIIRRVNPLKSESFQIAWKSDRARVSSARRCWNHPCLRPIYVPDGEVEGEVI